MFALMAIILYPCSRYRRGDTGERSGALVDPFFQVGTGVQRNFQGTGLVWRFVKN